MENLKKVPKSKEIEEKVKEGVGDITTKEGHFEDDGYNLEIIDDKDAVLDPFIISKKDPNYEYRFLRDDSKNISIKTGNLLHYKGGWQLVPKVHLLKIGVSERLISPDGLYRVGDQILSRMPKELYLRKDAEKKRRANEPMDAVKRLIKDGDKSKEVTSDVHGTQQGLQTQKALNM